MKDSPRTLPTSTWGTCLSSSPPPCANPDASSSNFLVDFSAGVLQHSLGEHIDANALDAILEAPHPLSKHIVHYSTRNLAQIARFFFFLFSFKTRLVKSAIG